MTPWETNDATVPANVSDDEWTDASDDDEDPQAGVHFLFPRPGAVSEVESEGDMYGVWDMKIGSANAPAQTVLDTMKSCYVVYLLSDRSDPPFDPQVHPVIKIDPMYLVPPAGGFCVSIKHPIEERNERGQRRRTGKFVLVGQKCPLYHPTILPCSGLHVVHSTSHYNYPIEISDSFDGPIWPDTGDWAEDIEIVLGHQVVDRDNNGGGGAGQLKKIDGVHWMVPVPGAVGNYGGVRMELILGTDPPDNFRLRTRVDCSILYLLPRLKGTPFSRQFNHVVCLNPNGLVSPADGWPESIKYYISEENADGQMERTEKFVLFAQQCPLHHPRYVPCPGLHVVYKNGFNSDVQVSQFVEVSESFEGLVWPRTGSWATDLEDILDHQDGKSINRDTVAVDGSDGIVTEFSLGDDGTIHRKKVKLSEPSTSEQLELCPDGQSIKIEGQEVEQESNK